MSAKKILVLPNYSKSVELPVLVQEGSDLNWRLSDYRSEIPKNLPKGAARGIPLKILSQNNQKNFILGRVVRQENPVVFLATQAGQDTTGRIVFLTLIVTGPINSLETTESTLHISAEALKVLENNPESCVPKEKIPDLKDAIAILNRRGDQNTQQALCTMWDNFQTEQEYNYFTSVSFREASAYLPDSEDACFGNKGTFRFPFSIPIVGGGALILFLLLMLRQCQGNHQAHGTQQPRHEPQPSTKMTDATMTPHTHQSNDLASIDAKAGNTTASAETTPLNHTNLHQMEEAKMTDATVMSHTHQSNDLASMDAKAGNTTGSAETTPLNHTNLHQMEDATNLTQTKAE